MLCVEVRNYELRPGGREHLHRLFHDTVAPMLKAAGHDVVFAGPSPHDPNGYVLIRAYASEAERAAEQDDFYGSAAWRDGPRELVLAEIVSYASSVLAISRPTLQAWRAELAKGVPG
jgi:hypothetical protein